MTIKSKYANKYVAFKGAGGTKLGELSEKQLNDLAIIAQESQHSSLLELFEGELPSLDELKGDKNKKETKPALSKVVAEGDVKQASSSTQNTGTGNLGGTTGNAVK